MSVVALPNPAAIYFWEPASLLTLLLCAAGFLGALPLLARCCSVGSWEQARIAFVPASVAVLGLGWATVTELQELAFTGGAQLIALGASLFWALFLLGLAIGVVVAGFQQLGEPALPAPRGHPLPRWAMPLLSVLGAAPLGLGFGLLLAPDFWRVQLPWPTTAFDAKAVAAFLLAIGVGVLLAITEDDYDRVRPGILTLTLMGGGGLAAMAIAYGEVDWAGLRAPIMVTFLVGMTVAGLLGAWLDRRVRARTS